MARSTLLTVSGTISPDRQGAVAAGRAPRADYDELADALDADVVDVARACGSAHWSGLLRRIGGGSVALAWYCFRRRKQYDLLVTDAEKVGFLFALAGRFVPRRLRHVTIGHRLSPPKKVLVHRVLGLRRRIDGVIVYSSAQRRVAIERMGYRPEQVLLTPFMVDTQFWVAPANEAAQRTRPLICAAGQELRDYPTLVEAVRGLDLDVVLAAASPWSRRRDTSADVAVPSNVTVSSFDPSALRALYAEATLVVVPLQQTDFQAGITTILEGMSMGRAIVCTRTEGQTDTIVDGKTGCYVEPGDVEGLCQTIVRLTTSPMAADELGRAGRAWAIEHADIVTYARRLAAFARNSAQPEDAFTSPSGSS